MRSFKNGDLVVIADGRTQVPIYRDGVQVGRMLYGETATVLDGVPVKTTGRIYVSLLGSPYWVNADDVELLVEDSDEDAVNHPSHYADGWSNGAEIIDITEHLNFCRGNAIKYIARAGRKDPDKEIEDLQKAAFYIQREIERLSE